MKYVKYHGLGNDYLVIQPEDVAGTLDARQVQCICNRNIRIEIWERGAGYTLASGSSSTAAAGVAFKLGLCDPFITVHMPGGNLSIECSKDFTGTMTGPVTRVCEGEIDMEIFQ